MAGTTADYEATLSTGDIHTFMQREKKSLIEQIEYFEAIIKEFTTIPSIGWAEELRQDFQSQLDELVKMESQMPPPPQSSSVSWEDIPLECPSDQCLDEIVSRPQRTKLVPKRRIQSASHNEAMDELVKMMASLRLA